METDQIERLLARDPLMCHYTVTAKDELPEIVKTYPVALVCNTHNADQPGEHWVAMYVDEVGDYVRTSTSTRRVYELYERTLLRVVS